VTLKDAAGQAEIQKWDALYKQITMQSNFTILSASGDNGASDYADLNATKISPTLTSSFPADDPWVTAVGGTTLNRQGSGFNEIAWNMSGGGLSAFFPMPTYQQGLPASVQTLLQQKRGVPDVAGNANPSSGLAMYQNGVWSTAGGTSASTPMWAALMAIANQMAGHSLGLLNPALYKIGNSPRYAQDFHDIIVGNNSVNAGGVVVKGFDAVPGWMQ